MASLSVLKEKLQEGLTISERISAKSSSLPILANVLLSSKENGFEISATDLEIGLRYRILAQGEQAWAAVLSPRPLSQFISGFKDQTITFTPSETSIKIHTKEFQSSFKTLNPEDFPIIPKPKGNEAIIDVDIQALCFGLASVANFTGQTQARPEISGVFFLFQKNALKLVGTDSFRLAEKTLQLAQESPKEISFILPQKTAREITSVFGDRTGNIRIFFSSTQVIFDYTKEGEPQEPKIQLVSRVIEGEYPHYQDVIPTKLVSSAVMQKDEFMNHLKAASVFSGKMNDIQVFIDPVRGGVHMNSQSTDIGENTSFLKGEVSGPKAEVAFNWRFLGEGFTHIKSKEIMLGVTTEDGPALLKPMQEEGYLYVVMPIKA